MQNVRIYRTVGTDRSRAEDEIKTPRCRMSESIELYAQIDIASKYRNCRMSESIEQLTQIDATRGQEPLEDAFKETPLLQEFNRLFAQIDI